MRYGLAVASVLFLLGAPAAASATGPRLLLTHVAPLTVAGRAFPAHERLVLEVRSGVVVRTRRLTTSQGGRFNAVFRATPVSHCTTLVIRAIQPNGSTTVLKRPPLPACMPVTAP